VAAGGLAVEIQINQIRGWLLIMPNQVAHQHIEKVIVDGNGFAKSGHGAWRSTVMHYTDKRTALSAVASGSRLDVNIPVAVGSAHHDQAN
jgi:hypothetical protein